MERGQQKKPQKLEIIIFKQINRQIFAYMEDLIYSKRISDVKLWSILFGRQL